jgi:hypothetical protein
MNTIEVEISLFEGILSVTPQDSHCISFGDCVIETFFIRVKIFAFSLKTLFEDILYSFTWYNIWHCYIVKCFLNIKFCILFLCFEVRRILEVITISNFRPKRNKCFCQYKRIFCCQNEKCQVKDSKFFTNFFFYQLIFTNFFLPVIFY